MNNTEKINKCREILHKTPVGIPIMDKEDCEFLLSVFLGHSEWEDVEGCGVSYITTQKTKYGTKCFYIYRTDGTSTDISLMHSIKNRTTQAEIKLACRTSIQPIISQFKHDNVIYGKTMCPFTGEILNPDNTHIDHYDMTFNELFREWIKDKDLSFLKQSINKREDNNITTYFTDKNIEEKFVLFHNHNTHLRAVSKAANLSILK